MRVQQSGSRTAEEYRPQEHTDKGLPPSCGGDAVRSGRTHAEASGDFHAGQG